MKRSCILIVLLTLTGACGPSSSPQSSAPIDLSAHENQVFSQHGEDGVIEKLFEIIEPGPRFVVEFGALDPIRNSNSRNLIQQGWGAFLIEGDETRAAKVAAAYVNNPKVTAQQAWVYPGNIEILFEEAGVPKDFDFLVIDIDSNDYYVWRAIHDFRPKVVMIEMNHQFPPPQRMVVDFHPMNYWDGSSYHGASLQSLYELAKQKGYELVYCMSWGPNAFFVDAQYYERFGIADNNPETLFKMWLPEGTPYTMPETGPPFEHSAFKVEKKWILDR